MDQKTKDEILARHKKEIAKFPKPDISDPEQYREFCDHIIETA